MSIIKGKTNTVAGVGKDGTGFTLFTPIWQDHLVNNASWLRADTFSWQSGAVYVAAYNHLVNDFNGTTSAAETIGSTTITYYRAEDGHKIVLPDQENTVMAIYNATGIAWYYILDTTNQRFKLPRNKYGFRGLETTVGSYFQGSVPAHKHQLVSVNEGGTGTNGGTNGFINAASTSTERVATNTDVSYAGNIVNATEYQDGAAVQSRSVETYLYFFVGNTVEEVTTINVGQLTESLNGKADTSLNNIPTNYDYVVDSKAPTAEDPSWYRVYKSGWVEQGGGGSVPSGGITLTFTKPYQNSKYTLIISQSGETNTGIRSVAAFQKKATSFLAIATEIGVEYYWYACGQGAN